jgi:hypothetical protein
MFFDKEDGSQDRTRMKIIGRQPKEKYQSVLRQVTYYNNKTSISCPVKRYILVTANDGQNVGKGFAHISIQFTNKYRPVINATVKADKYTEGGPAVGFGETIVISDEDERCSTSLIESAKFILYARDGMGNEKLRANQTLADKFAINVSLTNGPSGSVVLMLVGVASIQEYQDVLRSVTYNNSADEPSPEQRKLEVCDFMDKNPRQSTLPNCLLIYMPAHGVSKAAVTETSAHNYRLNLNPEIPVHQAMVSCLANGSLLLNAYP